MFVPTFSLFLIFLTECHVAYLSKLSGPFSLLPKTVLLSLYLLPFWISPGLNRKNGDHQISNVLNMYNKIPEAVKQNICSCRN